MPFTATINTSEGRKEIHLFEGASTIFVGANGGGKTRLAVKLEDDFGANAHRISAHRALVLNPEVAKISERQALKGLREGNYQVEIGRVNARWGQKPSVSLLNDFDFLVQALFSEQSNTALNTHMNARAGNLQTVALTKFETLNEIWKRLLPHRQLHISGDTIEVSVGAAAARYSAAEMSDGERAIFYMIGQVLVAKDNSVLIFDEPELHVHRSIMGKLWDELEAIRVDCAFVLITHDLEFAASRIGQKFVIRDYSPAVGWTIEVVPEETGFSEEVATLILGSRKPILFVEGASTSLDRTIYRACYPDWTVIPRSSCEQVIHSVVTMRSNASLTRVTCSGIVDADDYDQADAAYLARLGVQILPVTEIENLLLLPDVSRAIAEHEGYTGAELATRLGALKAAAFAKIDNQAALDQVVTRHCRRRIDRALKKVDLSAADTVPAIAAEYAQKTGALDVLAIGAATEAAIRQAVRSDNLPAFLRAYDDKGFLALAASHLKSTSQRSFVDWLSRVLRNDSVPALTTAIRGHLPPVTPQ